MTRYVRSRTFRKLKRIRFKHGNRAKDVFGRIQIVVNKCSIKRSLFYFDEEIVKLN